MLASRHSRLSWAAEERSVAATLIARVRRATALLGAALLLGAAVAGLALPIAAAQAQTSESISGRLTFEGEAVEAVRITVADPVSGATFVAISDDDGRWRIELSPGTYTVSIDTTTLPEGVALRDPERTSLEVRVLENASSAAIFALGEAAEAVSDTLRRFLQSSINGLKFGLIIGMTSVGLSLIFGTTGLVNFAHGDLVTIGAFAAYFLNVGVGLPLLVAAPIAIAIGALIAGALDRGLWRPLRVRQSGLISMLVVSIGLAFVLRHIVLLFFGGSRLAYSDYSLQTAMRFGLVRVQPVELWVMGLSIAMLVGVGLMLTTTRLGKSMRAVADNRDLAESSGIDVQRVILSVWILGGALTAVGGVFLGVIESVDYLMGFRLLLLMFAGVVLGGLGSAYGAMLGGLVVGFVSEVSTVWFSSQIKYVWALLVLIIILLVRPQGILGRRERFG
jgi:neutral amino acid transport system permease protein